MYIYIYVYYIYMCVYLNGRNDVVVISHNPIIKSDTHCFCASSWKIQVRYMFFVPSQIVSGMF